MKRTSFTHRIVAQAAALALLALALSVSGCSKKTSPLASGPQATVLLRDGSSFAGTVTKSSTQSITVVAPNGESRTYPMSQVDTVQYQPSGNGNPQAAVQPPQAAPAPASSAPPAQSPAAPAAEAATTQSPIASARRLAPVGLPEMFTAPSIRVIPAGARIVVRNNETIDSATAARGQAYSAVIVRNVVDTTGHIVIPHGSAATLVVRAVEEQGKVQGRSELALDLDAVTINGRRYNVDTSDFVKRGTEGVGENKRTAKFLGGGTALGALIGAVAGGGKGAAIGALSGAAAGTATQTVTRGHGVRVPAETLMTFRLEAPVHIRETP